ncbi:hypothetical protein Tco_0007580 [Tanacetum coccineum]
MTTTIAQQVVLDNALVPLENRVEIGKFNLRIDPVKTQKESTYHVFLDALALTTCYPAFLITADVPKIYMHQFWFTINKKDSTSYRFKIDKKSNDKSKDAKNPHAYKTYLAYATRATTPKKARKFKKPASPSKKRTLVTVEEEKPGPAKKVKNTPAKAERSKGIDLQSEAALLEESQVKKVLRRSRREQQSIKQVAQVMELVLHQGLEEYERINEELYGDVNVRLTDDEPADAEKDDEEMTVAGHVNVNQEGAGNQSQRMNA